MIFSDERHKEMTNNLRWPVRPTGSHRDTSTGSHWNHNFLLNRNAKILTSSFSYMAGFDENGEGSDLGHGNVSSRESNSDSGLVLASLSPSSKTDLVEIGFLHITILEWKIKREDFSKW